MLGKIPGVVRNDSLKLVIWTQTNFLTDQSEPN